MAWCSKHFMRGRRRQWAEPDSNLAINFNFKRSAGNDLSIPDLSGRGNNGTLVAGGVASRSLLGQGVRLSAEFNQFVHAHAVGMDGDRGTVMCWIKFDSLANTAFIFGANTGGVMSMYLIASVDGLTRRLAWGLGGAANATPAFLVRNVYHHVVMQWDSTLPAGQTFWVYVDGAQADTGLTGGAPITFPHELDVGNQSSAVPLRTFDGEIYDFRAYNSVLTAAQIAEIYRLGAECVQFKSDWGAPVSPAAEGGVIYQYATALPWQTQLGGAGRWVTELQTIQGRTCKVIRDTNGSCFLGPQSSVLPTYTGPFGNGAVASITPPSASAYGTWDFWAKIGAVPAWLYINCDFRPPGGNGFLLFVGAGRELQLQTAAIICSTAVGYITLAKWYHFRVIRRYDGQTTVWVGDETTPLALMSTAGGAGVNPAAMGGDFTRSTYQFLMAPGTNGAFALGDRRGHMAVTKYLGMVPPR